MILLSPGAVRKTISFAKDSRLMVLRSSQQICPSRVLLLSSSSSSSSNSKEENDPKERNRVLNYLETWVGTNSNNNTSSVMKSDMKNKNHDCNNDNTNDAFVSKLKNTVTSSHPRSSPLTITNASYLLPTLRIERQDTPESLSSQLHSTFVSAAAASFSSTRLAPNRSISILLQNIMKDGSSSRPRWRAPIVLDLQAIMPDGSPHYQAPSSGTIQQYKQVLAQYGLQVVGISNCPKSLEEECVTQAGLPLVWGITTQTSSSNPQNNINNLRANSSAIDVESALQLVRAKIEEEYFPDDNPNDNQKEKDEDDVLSTINRQKNTKEGKKSVISSVIYDKNLENTNIVETNTWSTIDMNSESRNAKKNSDSDMNEEITPNQNILTPPPNSKIYYGSIRSGQQVSTDLSYQSLIVIGSVNSGGECIADGDIYIFGKLRGRALAGLATASSSSSSQDSSDTRIIQPSPETSQTYRIFASNFDPELVCIGGTFTTVGKVQDFGLEEAGGAAMVTVDQKTEKLIFEKIVL